MRCGFRLLVAAACAVLVMPAVGQIRAQNAAGVAMGQVQFLVSDVAAETDFWVRLGGSVRARDDSVVLTLPGLLVTLVEGEPAAAAQTVDHIAFRVRSLEVFAARGFELELAAEYPGIASVHSPAGARIELFEEGTATNVGFAADVPDATAERHKLPLNGDLDSHHLHFYVPEAEIAAARDWYVEHFAATPGQRWRYLAADLPGMNLNFSAATEPLAATRGQVLSRIGFEVADLEAFCRELERAGIVFDAPYVRHSSALATAELTDPWGTAILLTEGLRPD